MVPDIILVLGDRKVVLFFKNNQVVVPFSLLYDDTNATSDPLTKALHPIKHKYFIMKPFTTKGKVHNFRSDIANGQGSNRVMYFVFFRSQCLSQTKLQRVP